MVGLNPVFRNLPNMSPPVDGFSAQDGNATLAGVTHKTIILLILFSLSASIMWVEHFHFEKMNNTWFTVIAYSVLAATACGFALLWIATRRNDLSASIAPIYAILQGGIIGFLSVGSNPAYSHIGVQTVCLTVIISSCLLLSYRFGLIDPVDALKNKLTVMTVGALLYYLGWLLLMMAGIKVVSILTGLLPSIVATMVLLVVIGMTMVSGFDAAVQCSKLRLPKYCEWYIALGLVASLFWLYVEILTLGVKAKKSQGA